MQAQMFNGRDDAILLNPIDSRHSGDAREERVCPESFPVSACSGLPACPQKSTIHIANWKNNKENTLTHIRHRP
jgi:hypothetical protein